MFKRLFGRGETPDSPGARAQIEQSLGKTRTGLMGRLAEVFGPVDIDDDTWDALEAQLIRSDVGAQAAADIVAELREKARLAGVRRASELPDVLHRVMARALAAAAPPAADGAPAGDPPRPYVILVAGVNGSGKTTSIAKLAHQHVRDGRAVVLVAADTFRAAAIDQLKLWGERIGVPVIAGQPGGDPGAVVFDALNSHAARSADVVIVDTAGRLHTQANLMAELVKVRNVVARVMPDAPHATLLVLDATTGQNGLAQAKAFTAAVNVTGLILAKLDSTAKGGVAFAVVRELGVPIAYVGTGEQAADLAPFDAAAYVDGVLGRVG
ncbi:signal recognition particle-docking protein FtsY [bacterium]|nr:MAG: signal recognition particle-docking protein FtsY [bacterium]